MSAHLNDGVDMEELTADEVGGVRRAWYVGERRRNWPNETQIRGKVEAHVLASLVLARVVAAVMPTSGRASDAGYYVACLWQLSARRMRCQRIHHGYLNGPIVLGTAGCATNPGVVSGTVDSSAAVAAPGSTGVTSVASPGWAVTNHGIITAGGNGVTGDALFTLTNSGVITAGDSGALIGGGSTVINSIGGTITGDFTGLSISANGGSTTGGPSTVDNAGTITSAGGFNDAIILGLGGTVTNRSTGTISATGVGVAGDTNPTIVNNFGQILDASTGVGLSAGGTVTNALVRSSPVRRGPSTFQAVSASSSIREACSRA